MSKRNTVRSLLLFLVLLAPGAADATGLESLDEFTARITDELRQTHPEAVETFVEANAARDAGDPVTAERLYRKVLEHAPDFQHATRRLCGVVLLQKRRAEALTLCREAFDAEASLENRSTLIAALVYEEGETPPAAKEIEEAVHHARTLVGDPRSGEYGLLSVCQAAAANQDIDLLRQASKRLDVIAPDSASTHYFGWIVAMSEQDLDAAEARLQRALAAGLPEDLHAELAAATADSRPVWPRLLRVGGIVGLVWLTILGLLLLVGTVLSAATLRAATRLPTVQSGESAGVDRALRRTYRTVLWLCCAYYYISIPLVLATVVAVGGGVIYAFVALGRIPIKLLVIVLGLMLITIWAALKSFFVRARDEDPGEHLDTSKHPRLRGVLDEVAKEIDTRPVDNVYLTPGTDLAVMERGGMLRQLRGASERCLILGVGVLEGMKLGPFKAILAHEYGHFSNRDTAGGGFALAVRRSLLTMAQSLAEGGAAAWYNPAWLFLNGFYRVFLRVSQGASRLQEILADRWAAFAYGAKQFERGLRHVINRSIRFDVHANATLNEVVEGQKPLANLYTYRPAKTPDEVEVVNTVSQAISAEPSPYDSHPSPRQRFEWVHGLEAKPTGDLGDVEEDAWKLFADRALLEQWMTERVRNSIQETHGVRIAARA